MSLNRALGRILSVDEKFERTERQDEDMVSLVREISELAANIGLKFVEQSERARTVRSEFKDSPQFASN